MKVYVLMMELFIDNEIIDYDVFGLYSSREKAEEAKEWRKRDNGFYEGCRPDLLYNRCCIFTRILDYNLPNEKEEQSSLRDWQKEIMFSEGHLC